MTDCISPLHSQQNTMEPCTEGDTHLLPSLTLTLLFIHFLSVPSFDLFKLISFYLGGPGSPGGQVPATNLARCFSGRQE